MSDLDEIFAKAAEIAKKLPENLQEAAFNRALDELLESRHQDSPAAASSKAGKKKEVRRGAQETVKDDAFDNLLHSIDRTKHSDVGSTARVADRALKVLQLANDEYGVDGLTSTQVASILSRKFRLPVKSNAVQMALQRESQTVDVVSGPGGKNIFRIMAPGDEYLERLRAGSADTGHADRKKGARKKKAKKKPERTRKKTTNNKAKKKGGQRVSTRLGPKAAIQKLIEAKYFVSPRKISEIQDELKHTWGYPFKVQALSPTLVRSVRDGLLSRTRNNEGQYEYAQV